MLCTLAEDNKIMHKNYRKLSVFSVLYRVPVQDCAVLISDHDYYNLFKQKHWQSFSLVLILNLIYTYAEGALKCEKYKIIPLIRTMSYLILSKKWYKKEKDINKTLTDLNSKPFKQKPIFKISPAYNKRQSHAVLFWFSVKSPKTPYLSILFNIQGRLLVLNTLIW